jgi:RNA polymerase sigma-70 factor (ECF subfamily)
MEPLFSGSRDCKETAVRRVSLDVNRIQLRQEDIGRYRPQLLRYARQRLRDPALAEDAVQEALVAAVENAHRFAGGSSPATWLTGILKHKIADSMRAAGRQSWEELREEDMAASADRAPAGDPEQDLLRRGFFDCLERCLQALPRRAARVFVLREIMGLNIAETCRELAISATYCSVSLHRARRQLRTRLAAEGYGAEGAG